MKRIFNIISAAVLTLGLAACAKETVTPAEPVTPETKGQITIVANIGDDAESTKTTYSGDDQTGYDILWSAGDQITFYIGEDVKEYFTYTLTEGAGTKSGKFTGPAVPADIEYTAYAIYGDNLLYALQGLLADVQYYTPGNSAASFPMAAKATISNGEVTLDDFRNIGGMLRLDLKGSGTVKEIKITVDQPLTGGVIRIGADGGAYFENAFFSKKYVTLDCGQSGEALGSDAKPFYISLLAGDYTGVKIEMSDFAGHKFTKSLKADKSLNIARSMITSVAFTATGLTDDNVPLTWDSPEGARGVLDGRECVVVDLGRNVGKVAVATKNIGAAKETDYGTYFTWAEAANAQRTESWGKGWHLPTREEIEAFGFYACRSSVTSGCIEYKFTETSSLFLPLGGFYDTENKKYEFRDVSADYWGEEIIGLNPDMLAVDYESYGLVFTIPTGHSSHNNYHCWYKLTVRPIHKLPMTRNTPVGMKARLGDRDAMPVELTVNGARKKVAIAIKNEGANTENMYYEQNGTKYLDCFGTYFTYDQAAAHCSDGWYLPSLDEAKALFDHPDYEITQPRDALGSNVFWLNKDSGTIRYNRHARKIKVDGKSTLMFPATGYADYLTGRGTFGDYWTSTGNESDPNKQWMYGMIQASDRFLCENKTLGLTIRLFHEIPR